MTKRSRTKKIAYFLKIAGNADKIPQMKADIEKCDKKIERDFVEQHYSQFYREGI